MDNTSLFGEALSGVIAGAGFSVSGVGAMRSLDSIARVPLPVVALAIALSVATPETLVQAPTITGEVSFGGTRDARPVVDAISPVAAEMEAYRSLAAGWDGVGSIAPNPGAIDDALAFLRSLPTVGPLPEPTVSADGQVGWFWKHSDTYIDVTFLGGHHFAYYARARGQIARDTAYLYPGFVPQPLLDVIKLI